MSFKDIENAVVGLTGSVLGAEIEYLVKNADEATTIKGVFDNAWVEVEGVVSLKPTVRINLADLEASPGKGDTVTIDEVEYRITESREDGYGGTTLILQRA